MRSYKKLSTRQGRVGKLSFLQNVGMTGKFSKFYSLRALVFLLTMIVTSAACQKEEEDRSVSKVNLNYSEVSLVRGDEIQLTAEVLPENAIEKTVTWSSDNESVATVDETGLVKALAIGKANVSAQAGGKTAVCSFDVTAVPVEEIVISYADDETNTAVTAFDLIRTKEVKLKARISPEAALEENYPFEWSSSDDNIATVGQDGVVRAVAKEGVAEIKVAVGGKTQICTVTAKPRPIDYIICEEVSKSLKVGETYQVLISVTPVDNDDMIVWASSDESVAVVGETGIVEAKSKGNTKITAKSTLWPQAHYGECDIMVYEDEQKIKMEFVTIPAGTFYMGSPDGKTGELPKEPRRLYNETRHKVTITKAFQMGTYEVTNAQYAAFLNDAGVKSDGKSTSTQTVLLYASSNSTDWGLHYDSTTETWVPVAGYENFPVINVTWYGASEFAQWAEGSLPTEAQWEYACRGGLNDLPFGLGDGKRLTGEMANYMSTNEYDYKDGNGGTTFVGGNPPRKTTEVGSYQPNAYGLYDMHGNVYEWCADYFVYDLGTSEVTDPVGPDTTSDELRVVKGGSFATSPAQCRCAAREGMSTSPTQGERYGFRIVKPVE